MAAGGHTLADAQGASGAITSGELVRPPNPHAGSSQQSMVTAPGSGGHSRMHRRSRCRDVNNTLVLRPDPVFHLSELAQELGMRRETIDRYLLTLERLLLIRRLPAWHRHAARRLVKTPKAHIVDSGLASTLAGMSENDWLKRRGDMGRVLESFVVQQIIVQSTWTDQNLRFWHYRDKDQVEVDLVITRGQEVWGVEVKAGSTVSEHDAAGLRRLANQTGPSFRMGIVLYAGDSTMSLGNGSILAVPLSELWET